MEIISETVAKNLKQAFEKHSKIYKVRSAKKVKFIPGQVGYRRNFN